MRKVLQILLIIIIVLMIIAIPAIGIVKTNPNSYSPRWRNHAYAKINNYEWSKCPICKESFGEHEIIGKVNVAFVTEKNTNKLITHLCSRCTLAAMDLEKNEEQINTDSIIGRRAYFVERE